MILAIVPKIIDLTSVQDGSICKINVTKIVVIEPDAASGGSHVILDGNAVGRVVKETPDQVAQKINSCG